MLKKIITITFTILVLTSVFFAFNQSISSASTSGPSKLSIYAGPASLLADNSTYTCVFVQLEDSSGLPTRALQDTTISLSSSQINVGKIDFSIIIHRGITYASANFNTTFSPGTTIISASASGFATVQTSITTVGPIPSTIVVYGFPSTLPADGNSYSAIMVQLQDSNGAPARAPQGDVQVTLSSSDTTVGTVDSTTTIPEGQTYTIANFTTTTKAQTEGHIETAMITAVSQGYSSNQVRITTTPVASNPSQLKIFVGPPQVLADQNSYKQIAIELQDPLGYAAVNQSDVIVTVTSNDQSICKVDSITIPQMQTYALATLNSTFKAGSATLTAVATDLQWDHNTINTFGFIPSKLAIYAIPSSLPADGTTYPIVQVQLQDSLGRPAKDPQTDVSVNLFSSQPTVGVVTSTLTIPFGKTQATGEFAITNVQGINTITAQSSGYTTGLAQITTYFIDFASLQINVTGNPTSIKNGNVTAITVYVTANGSPVMGATLSFTSNNGGSFGTIEEQGNGYYNVSFTAPSFSTTTSCTITTSGSKTGYMNAQGITQITVVPDTASITTPVSGATPTPTPKPTTTLAVLTFKIIDGQGNPLNDTIVTSIIQPVGIQTLLQVSNATGYVSFENATAGSYTFKIIKQGYPETNETLEYNGQPLTLSIPLTANTESNPNANNLIAIVAVIIVSVAVVAVVSVLLVKRRKAPNIKNLQELKKQMDSKNKF